MRGRGLLQMIEARFLVLVMAVTGFGVTVPAVASQACSSGAVRDDGTVESGYGFVPSSTYGIYVQEMTSQAIGHPFFDSVCVCWLKTRGDRDVDFEVVVYEEENGRPAATPIYSVPATAHGVPKSVAEAGAFAEVDMGRLAVPKGTFFLGARWSPQEDAFLFVCVDRSEETEKRRVFFQESAIPRWVAVTESKDPIFAPHRAIMVRAVGTDTPPPPPVKRPENASGPPALAPPD